MRLILISFIIWFVSGKCRHFIENFFQRNFHFGIVSALLVQNFAILPD